MEVFVGFSIGSRCLKRNLEVAIMPSLFGMLVYKLATSRVAKMAPLGTFRSLIEVQKVTTIS